MQSEIRIDCHGRLRRLVRSYTPDELKHILSERSVVADCGYATPCRLWTGPVNREGYGKITVRRKTTGTHRIAWELYIGPIPDDMGVLHKCDQMRCLEPTHFFLGTNTDNCRDKCEKGRQLLGSRNHFARLTEKQVLEIRRRWPQESRRQLASAYGVQESAISKIVLRRTWRHLP